MLVASVWSAIRVPWVPRPRAARTGWLCPDSGNYPSHAPGLSRWANILKPLSVAVPAATTAQQQQIQNTEQVLPGTPRIPMSWSVCVMQNSRRQSVLCVIQESMD